MSLLILLQSQAAGGSHDTTGALTGPGSTLAGAANRTRVHATSGALAGPGAVIVGAANHAALHATTGVLAGQGSSVAGTAARTRAHGSSGALAGPGTALSASAARFRAFATSGALDGPGATLTGSASRSGGAVTHDTSGALVGPGAEIAAEATRARAAAGGYDDDEKPKRKRRFIVERDGKLLVFGSQSAALRALEQEPEALPEAPVEVQPAPEVVDLPTVQAYAETAGRVEEYNAARNSRHYEALLRLFEQLQDEEDIEMLLLAV